MTIERLPTDITYEGPALGLVGTLDAMRRKINEIVDHLSPPSSVSGVGDVIVKPGVPAFVGVVLPDYKAMYLSLLEKHKKLQDSWSKVVNERNSLKERIGEILDMDFTDLRRATEEAFPGCGITKSRALLALALIRKELEER